MSCSSCDATAESIVSSKRLYVDSAIRHDRRARQLVERWPSAAIVTSQSHRGEGWFLTRNQGRFLKPCPGQKGHVCCGYYVLELVLGCPIRCEYCALQAYQKSGDVTLYVNVEDALDEIRQLRLKRRGIIRLGTGEFGDSLALEPIFSTLREVVQCIAALPDVVLELKTKTDLIEPLENLGHSDRVIVGFSLNAAQIARRYEHGAATMESRLRAAQRAQSLGYRVSFHFDPLICFPGWRQAYTETVRALADTVRPEAIAWISLGTLRFPGGFEDRVRSSFPDTNLFAEEFYPSRDGKRRYFRPLREQMYSHLMEQLGPFAPDDSVYLCMEADYVWERLLGKRFTTRCLIQRLDRRGHIPGGA